MYLADLTYLDTVHPQTGGLDDERNKKVSIFWEQKYPACLTSLIVQNIVWQMLFHFKMNNIIRVIAEFQQSNYGKLMWLGNLLITQAMYQLLKRILNLVISSMSLVTHYVYCLVISYCILVFIVFYVHGFLLPNMLYLKFLLIAILILM